MKNERTNYDHMIKEMVGVNHIEDLRKRLKSAENQQSLRYFSINIKIHKPCIDTETFPEFFLEYFWIVPAYFESEVRCSVIRGYC